MMDRRAFPASSGSGSGTGGGRGFFSTGRLMDIWIFFMFVAIADVAASVEVHFENKDGGFFLKHIPRQYYPARGTSDTIPPLSTGASNNNNNNNNNAGSAVPSPPPGSVLSIDKFTVFQTSEPVSVRATYGPFSTKQTVPARYIVPDPLDALPGPETRRNLTAATILDAQELGARHLDMSAHLVGNSVPRDSPVLRVLFHAGSEASGRRQLLMARHQRVCVVLHASLASPSRGNAASRSSTGHGYSSSSSSSALTAVCSPDGENGVCLAQITIPADWWPPLPPPDASGRVKVAKSLPRLIQVAYSVLEPRTEEGGVSSGGSSSIGSGSSADSGSGFCRPRVQIQPVTPLGQVPLAPNKADYKELRADDSLTLLVPHGPLYPRSRLHIPAFLHPIKVTDLRQERPPLIVAVYLRARVKSGIKILDASSSSPDWIVDSDVNVKNTAATFTARRKENSSRIPSTSAEEIMTMLLEASEEGIGGSWDGGRIVWSVRYTLEGEEENSSQLTGDQSQQRMQQRQLQHHHHHHVERRKLQARLEIQKDDIQAVLPISKNWEVMNTAVLTGRQVSQGMKVFIVSQAGTVADVTLQSSCHSEDESVLKVSSSCSSVYVDGSEIRGSSNASVLVKYGTYTGLARFTVWMPELPLEVSVADTRLNQIKGWKVPEEHVTSTKSKRSLLNATQNEENTGVASTPTISPETPLVTARAKKRSAVDLEESIEDTSIDVDDPDGLLEEDEHEERFQSNGNDHGWDTINSIDRNLSPTNCRLRFQQSPVEVHARFLATDHDSGRVSYFVNRRTWLRVTDLIAGMLRVSDPRIATLLQNRLVQGRGVGRTEVQVLSPITGRVIGAKEIRVGNDRVSVTRLSVRVVSGLQLSISPDTAIENGYIAETSVTRRLTAQYQEGLLDIDVEFSDSTHTPLREIAVSDYHLLVESLDPEVVAFAPMVASHHPRVIAVGEGRGDLLRVTLQLADSCRLSGRRSSKGSQRTVSVALASASANVEVDFASSEVPNRPEFVQNDGGGTVGSHHHKERKTGRGEMASDLHDILIGGMSGVGVRHHGVGARMSPLEIGMYVLLAAFCFAIVVFVVSCVVYASKFKPQPPDSPLTGAAVPVLSGAGARARAAANQLASAGRRPPRESTTNAHDWVWLGRATLERAACGPQQVRVTSNPLAGEGEPEAELGTCFDNPNHIELPSSNQRPSGSSSVIDTTTYSKKDRIARNSFAVKSAGKPSAVIPPTTATTVAAATSMVAPKMTTARNDNDDIPPPLPPHGVPITSSTSTTVTTATTTSVGTSANNGNNEDYKPPVPPHRNTGMGMRLPEPPRKHRHRASSSGSGGHHGNNHRSSNKTQQQSNHHIIIKPHGKTKMDNANKQNGENEEFVELVNHDDNRHVAKDAERSREIKRATIVGNPMYSSFSTSAVVSTAISTVNSSTPTSGAASSTTTSPPSSSPSASSSSSSSNSSCASSFSQEQEESVALDDLNLGMDYNQIMQYFDNLKESNA
ncbi:transmembrane protein 132E isoform X2 [Monomorium pharaonis]|uniref:transmembrane protein 132E isoform X2 n=1 Tax=Monomorium pharaonis TaxID=307658 RepID=UPI00063EE332|nr:transmembrane protein 132E isoform X2 [Monomorium pharaonis]